MERVAERMGGTTKWPYNDSDCLDAAPWFRPEQRHFTCILHIFAHQFWTRAERKGVASRSSHIISMFVWECSDFPTVMNGDGQVWSREHNDFTFGSAWRQQSSGTILVYAAHKSGLRRSSSWLLIASSRTYCEQCLQCFLLSQSFILSFGTAFYTLLCFFNACRVYKPALDTCFYIPMHLAYSGMVDLWGIWSPTYSSHLGSWGRLISFWHWPWPVEATKRVVQDPLSFCLLQLCLRVASVARHFLIQLSNPFAFLASKHCLWYCEHLRTCPHISKTSTRHFWREVLINSENQIYGVITESKSGRQAILADRVIDCTGPDLHCSCLQRSWCGVAMCCLFLA